MTTIETTPTVHGFFWDGARWRMPTDRGSAFAVYGRSGEPVRRDGFEGSRRYGARSWISADGQKIVARAADAGRGSR